MRLTDKTLATLTVPKGRSEAIVFDDDLPGLVCGCAPAEQLAGFTSTTSGPAPAG